MKSKLALMASALCLCAVAPVWAGNISFNFSDCGSIVSPYSGCPGDLGTTQAVYNDATGTYQVAAYASPFSGPSAPDLFVRNDGGSENGLGLAGTFNNEINYTPDTAQYIFLDMTELADSGIGMGTVTLGSLQTGESGTVCDFGESGLGHCQQVSEWGNSGYGSAFVTWSTIDPYLVFWQPAPSQGNFLISSLTANSVPEPGSAALLALGLGGLGLAIARRRRATAIG